MDNVRLTVWITLWITLVNIQVTESLKYVQCVDQTAIDTSITCSASSGDYFLVFTNFYYGKTQTVISDFCDNEIDHISSADCIVENEETYLVYLTCNGFSNCNSKKIQPNPMVGCDMFTGDTYGLVEYECVRRENDYGQTIDWQDFGKTLPHSTNDSIYLISSSYPEFKQHELNLCNIEMPAETTATFEFLLLKSLDPSGNNTACAYQFNVNDRSTLLEFCFNEVEYGVPFMFPAATMARTVQVVLQPNSEIAKASLMVRITVRHKDGGPPPYAMSIICDPAHTQLPTPASTLSRAPTTTLSTPQHTDEGNMTTVTSIEGTTKPGKGAVGDAGSEGWKIGGVDAYAIIAGAAAGGLVLLVIFIIVICLAIKQHRRNNKPPKTLEVIDAWDGYGTAEMPKEKKANVDAYDYAFPDNKKRPVKIHDGYDNHAMEVEYSEPVTPSPLYENSMEKNGHVRQSNGYHCQINGPSSPINRQESLSELYSKPHKNGGGTRGRKSMSPQSGGTDRYIDEDRFEGRVYDGRGTAGRGGHHRPPVVDDTYTYSSEITPRIGGEIYQ